MEKAKRLTPSKETLRQLYLKCGNQCAFPGCPALMINREGIFVGQLCHIEGAEEGGERFNPAMTNEQRRAFANLMLMCYEHHTVTNDEAIYTVSVLRKMKADHEARFTDIASAMLAKITDHTTLTTIQRPTSLKRMSSVLKWNLDPDQEAKQLAELIELGQRLRSCPIPTREFLCVLVRRSTRKSAIGANNDLEVSPHEVQEATGLEDYRLKTHLQILDKEGIITEGFPDDFGLDKAEIVNPDSGWQLWSDLRTFSKLTGISLETILINLDFSVLS